MKMKMKMRRHGMKFKGHHKLFKRHGWMMDDAEMSTGTSCQSDFQGCHHHHDHRHHQSGSGRHGSPESSSSDSEGFGRRHLSKHRFKKFGGFKRRFHYMQGGYCGPKDHGDHGHGWKKFGHHGWKKFGHHGHGIFFRFGQCGCHHDAENAQRMDACTQTSDETAAEIVEVEPSASRE